MKSWFNRSLKWKKKKKKKKKKQTKNGKQAFLNKSYFLNLALFHSNQWDLRHVRSCSFYGHSRVRGSRTPFHKNADFLDDFSVNARNADIFKLDFSMFS